MRIEPKVGVLQGSTQTVSIDLVDAGVPLSEIGHYDLLIKFDRAVLTLETAVPGRLLTDCGWEYFTYLVGPATNCGPMACPYDVVRVRAVADIGNDDAHPACYSGPGGQLAELSFRVTKELEYEGTSTPI